MIDFIERLCKMFVDARDELVKNKSNAPKPKGEKTPRKSKSPKKDSVLGDVELTDEQKKAIKIKSKDSKETRAASVPGVRRPMTGKATFYGKQLGGKKISPKKRRHVVEQAARTVSTPTKRASITQKSDDIYIKEEDE
jgi:hypothetical protein